MLDKMAPKLPCITLMQIRRVMQHCRDVMLLHVCINLTTGRGDGVVRQVLVECVGNLERGLASELDNDTLWTLGLDDLKGTGGMLGSVRGGFRHEKHAESTTCIASELHTIHTPMNPHQH